MADPKHQTETRAHILEAALKTFAHYGYAAASVQQIVDAAEVSKPALYYYFADKAELFGAIVDNAHDERYRLMKEASELGDTIAQKLEAIVAAAFEFSVRNQELMRLAFATAFASGGESPGQTKCREKGRRNYEFVRALIEKGQASGELRTDYTADDLAMGIYGQLTTYIMVRLLLEDGVLDRDTARRIVELFMSGAAAGSGSMTQRGADELGTKETL